MRLRSRELISFCTAVSRTFRRRLTSTQNFMSNSFTPGPWKVHRYGSDGVEILADYSDQFPVLCNTTDGISFHSRGDAQLVAAAPELCESLSQFVEWFNSERNYSSDILFELVEKAEAALKKAGIE
jgi:hypothetical protein